MNLRLTPQQILSECSVTQGSAKGCKIQILGDISNLTFVKLDGCVNKKIKFAKCCDYAVVNKKAVCLVELKCPSLSAHKMERARKQFEDTVTILEGHFGLHIVQRIVCSCKLDSIVKQNRGLLEKNKGMLVLTPSASKPLPFRAKQELTIMCS